MKFRKMNGLGNDFVILDARAEKLSLSPGQIAAICDRATGIGCDQLLVLEPPPGGADAFMRIYNADGTQAGACGNGTRCVGRILMIETGKDSVTIVTKAGVLIASGGAAGQVSVDMGVPKLLWNEIPLAEPFADTRMIELQIGPIDAPLIHSPAVVNMGNPHAVFFVDDLDVVDLSRSGAMLEHHPIFPERANITLARVNSAEHITIKVWERGAGLTKACGTAACAAAVSGVRKRLTSRNVTVTLPGGDLQIEWRESDSHVVMTGPVEDEGGGEIPPALLQEAAHVS